MDNKKQLQITKRMLGKADKIADKALSNILKRIGQRLHHPKERKTIKSMAKFKRLPPSKVNIKQFFPIGSIKEISTKKISRSKRR